MRPLNTLDLLKKYCPLLSFRIILSGTGKVLLLREKGRRTCIDEKRVKGGSDFKVPTAQGSESIPSGKNSV